MPRLDQLLVERGHYRTRSRARDAILRGSIKVEGLTAGKPALSVPPHATIEIADAALAYVSRAALKLAHGLDHFALSPHGLAALDLGASTGGFTQLLLERGARHVTALDVGHGQLASELAADPRVILLEGLNARDLGATYLTEAPEFISADLSFISLKLALPPALALAAPGAQLVALIKPQFEAGAAHISKAGLVRDAAVQEAVCRDIANWLQTAMAWQVLGTTPSPIAGGSGNREFLVAANKPRQCRARLAQSGRPGKNSNASLDMARQSADLTDHADAPRQAPLHRPAGGARGLVHGPLFRLAAISRHL